VGALVLLAVGVIGFPILFETQPRPLPVDTPIEIVRPDGSLSVATAPARLRARPQPVTLPPPDAGIEAVPAGFRGGACRRTRPSCAAAESFRAGPGASVPTPAKPPEEAPRERPAPPPAAKPAPATVAVPAVPPVAVPVAPPAGCRPSRAVCGAGRCLPRRHQLRDARQKVEKLGLKTYTQVVETPTGKRTRVRVGPYATAPTPRPWPRASRPLACGRNVLTL
jgi:DedD protein